MSLRLPNHFLLRRRLIYFRILFIRRIVQLWYNRIGNAEGDFHPLPCLLDAGFNATIEKTLKELLRQQRTKIEEIKKKTNYYSTRNLLERYDESPSDVNAPLRRRNVPGGPSSAGPQAPSTPQRAGQPSGIPTPLSKLQTQAPMSPSLKNHLAGIIPNSFILHPINASLRDTPANSTDAETVV